MPSLSVILPFHNPGKYFSGAIDSILSQTFDDFELLLLDDASDDGSSEVASDFANRDSRIRIIRANSNLGLSRQLNRGIEESTGDFIARMDADDFALPNRFENQLSVFKTNPDIGICGCLVDEISQTGEETGYRWDLPTNHDQIVSLQFIRCGFNHPSVMFRKSVLIDHSLRYREDFKVAQDYELWIRLLQHANGYNIQEPLLKYRRFPEQLSQASSPRKLEEVSEIRGQILKLIGVENSEQSQTMHNRFCDDQWVQDVSWFKQLIEWLNMVYQTNLRTGAMPRKAFGQLLADRLYMQCHMATGRKFSGYRIFKEADFCNDTTISTVQSVKNYVKSLIA